MKSLTDLPIELLNIIFMMLAASSTGYRDLALIAATCKLFKNLSVQPHILREIKFCIVCVGGDVKKNHSHRRGGIIIKGSEVTTSWVKMTQSSKFTTRETLQSHALVRSFVRNAWYIDIAKMRYALRGYVNLFIGHHMKYASAIIECLDTTCKRLHLETYVHTPPCYHSDAIVVMHYTRLKIVINRLLYARKALSSIFDELPTKRFIKFGTIECEI